MYESKIILADAIGNSCISMAVSIAAVKLKKPAIMLLLPFVLGGVKIINHPINDTEKAA